MPKILKGEGETSNQVLIRIANALERQEYRLMSSRERMWHNHEALKALYKKKFPKEFAKMEKELEERRANKKWYQFWIC